MANLVIGVRGKYGVGKSEAAVYLSKISGARYVNADQIVHDLYEPGQAGAEAVSEVFGEDFLDEEGRIDRVKLRGVVLGQQDKMLALNDAVHVLVLAEVNKILAQSDLVVVEAFDFSEKYLGNIVDILVCVRADRDLVWERVKNRGVSEEEFEAFWELQEEEEDCDYVVDNHGGKEEMYLLLDEVWRRIVG